MALPLRVGGEVDSFCTRCRMLLAHTILAMMGTRPVRVQCNTCGGQHNYRAAPDAPRSSVAKTAKTAKTATSGASARTERLSFDDQLASKVGAGKAYSPKATFLVDEVVLHPTFGRGFVAAVRQDKIDVAFNSGTRTLVHARS